MKKLFLAVFLIAVTATFAQSGTKNFIDQNYIEELEKLKPKLLLMKFIFQLLLMKKIKKEGFQ